MRKLQTAAAVAILAATSVASAAAQDFSWRGELGRGETLEIRGVNGEIHAVRASGNEVRVTAIKEEGRRGNPDDVTVEVVEHDGGITICAVYPARDRDRPNECRAGGGRMDVRENDTRVDFEVQVPAGVVLRMANVNGEVTAENLAGPVHASTVNGSVDLSTSDEASAHTVNGSITARFSGRSFDDDLEFETVNGRIVIEIDGEVNADVSASTVNGGIETDFPLTVRGRWGPKRVSGTIGQGGPNLSLTTVNGAIEIRRR